METTPYFLCAPQSAADAAGFGAARETEMALVAPEAAVAVAPARMRRVPSGSSGKQQQGGGSGGKKTPQRGLGVAELERLRCGGDPLRDLNAAVAAAMGDAAAVHGHPIFHHHHHLPTSAFDVATGAPYISPLLAQPSPAPPAPPAPVCYVHSAASPAGGQGVAPEKAQQFFMDRWGRMGGFAPAANARASHHHPQPPAPAPLAPEFPSSQSTIWRPVPSSSSSSCLHTGHRCDLCSRTMVRTSTEKGARTPTAATIPDYSIYEIAAAMATARKQENGEAGFLPRESKTKEEVREIEFFPTSAAANGRARGHDHPELAAIGLAPFSSTSGAGGCTVPATATATLDLSLRL